MRRMMRGVLAVAAAGMLEAEARGEDGAPWSKEVNGLQVRVELAPAEVFSGTLLVGSRLGLKNVQSVGSMMPVAWTRAKLTFRVEDDQGKELHMGPSAYSGFVPAKRDLVLPFKGELSFEITDHGAGVGGDATAMLALGPHYMWAIPGDGRTYYLSGTLEIAQVGTDPPWFGWYGKIDIPRVAIPTKAPSLDHAAAGKLIEEFGPVLLGKNSQESEEAARRLSLIADDRVVPWYVKALQTDNYELKSMAIDRLWRMKGDEALGALKMAMATQGKDIGNCTTPAVADSCAVNIRVAAAYGLGRREESDAKKWLLSMAGDPAPSVRIIVVQAAEHMTDAASLVVMKTLANDGDAMVRDEATLCLQRREQKK